MKMAGQWAVRAVVAAVCVFLTYWSARMAVADLRAQRNGVAGLDAAIRMEPNDSVLEARRALYLANNGDTSATTDEQLQRAAQLDPLNSELQMALGLRAEFRGDLPEAERYLVHAAAIDHTFKPAWTLANFYARNNEPDKTWPMIRRALNLNPLAFDPTPVFDLGRHETSEPAKILDMIPARGNMPLQYLYFLMGRNRPQEALQLLPRVLTAAQLVHPPDPAFTDGMTALTEFLIKADRVADAVRVWNELVERQAIASGTLHPERGISIANPDFRYPPIHAAFGWQVTQDANVRAFSDLSSLRLEFNGKEPESLQLLTTTAPLVGGKAYRLTWKTDASQLSSPRDPGFTLQIVQEPGDTTSECQPLLQTGAAGCLFTARPNADRAQINVSYKRALGTTRVEGTLQILNIRLEFGS